MEFKKGYKLAGKFKGGLKGQRPKGIFTLLSGKGDTTDWLGKKLGGLKGVFKRKTVLKAKPLKNLWRENPEFWATFCEKRKHLGL